jgi:transcriptional regulator with XRE-family HTH domain
VQRSWAEIGVLVKQRRLALQLSQRACATRAGLSPTTWGSVENGTHPMSSITRVGVARAIGWPADAIDRLLDGADPDTWATDASAAHAPNPPELGSRVRDALQAEIITQLLSHMSISQLHEFAAFGWWITVSAAAPTRPDDSLDEYLSRSRVVDFAQLPDLARRMVNTD